MVDLEQLIVQVPGQLNIPVVIGLMAIGYIIKNTKALNMVSNKIIPLILLGVSIVLSIILADGYSMKEITMALISGLSNAAIAVWAHETGKNVFEMVNAKDIKNMIDSMDNDNK